ncbi:MAG: amidohydrolase family protein [Alphaproteobacteria bacterium]|jgi:2-pyrone-4,6-dicarboxylate lactonase|nr:amidohydrolase family protein [Alphaproteobacteria bacterium]
MVEKLKSPPPDRNPKTPQIKLPAGATDTHFHIYGPQARFPFNPASPLDVEDSTLDDMLQLHNTLRIERGVIVQSVVQGNCYEYMVHALSREPDRLRGIALPAPDITDRELEILTTAGVVGARFAYRASPDINMDLIHRTHEFGWHPQFWFRGPDEAAAWRDQMLSVPGNFVIDHMGWQPAEMGIDSPGFKVVLECLDTGRCWVKLSGPNRFSAEPGLPYSDAVPFAQALIERNPDRLLWGSDWPHPDHFEAMPNDGDLIDLMLTWAPDEALRKKIFTDNPAELFGFPAV